MYHYTRLNLAAGGSQDNPERTVLRLFRGTIDTMEIFFPPGCAGLVGCWLQDRSWWLMPWSGNTPLRGNDRVFSARLNYELDVQPYEIVVYAFNLDDLYDHTIDIGINVIEPQPLRSSDYAGYPVAETEV